MFDFVFALAFFFIIIIWNIEIKPPFEVHLVPHSGERPYKCNLFSYFALANYQHNNFYYHVYYLDLFYFSKFFQRSSKKKQLLEIICSLTSEKSHTNVYCSALLLLFTCLFNFILFFFKYVFVHIELNKEGLFALQFVITTL